MRVRFLLLVLLILGGCAMQPLAPSRAAVSEITRFAFTGRLAVRQNEQRHHVHIDWRHTPERDVILLATAFGQGLAELERDAAGARLTLADQRSMHAEDWDALAQQAFGFALPLNAAPRWLVGDLSSLDGWRVAVLARENAAGLPTLIELERDDIVVRLKIDAWLEAQ